MHASRHSRHRWAALLFFMLALAPAARAPGQRLDIGVPRRHSAFGTFSAGQETERRAGTYVIAGALIGGIAAAVAFGPELHETEAFPGGVAYGIAAAGGAVIGALVGRLVFSIRQAGRSRRFP